VIILLARVVATWPPAAERAVPDFGIDKKQEHVQLHDDEEDNNNYYFLF
jgi:hypothetical protein